MITDILISLDTALAAVGLGTVVTLARRARAMSRTMRQIHAARVASVTKPATPPAPAAGTFTNSSPYTAPSADDLKQ